MKRILSMAVILMINGLFFTREAGTTQHDFPGDFPFLIPSAFEFSGKVRGGAGGGRSRIERHDLKHYPVIMVHANARDHSDWSSTHPGNAPTRRGSDVYRKFIIAGFRPVELWMLRYTERGVQMANIEELTDNLRSFIYAVLWYTGAPKVQILAHGEGSVLAQAALKKYNLYNLVHAAVYIAGPFHGSKRYSYIHALRGYPVHANLAPGSGFLQELNIPDETPYNLLEGEEEGNFAIKYMTIYQGISKGDEFYPHDSQSPALLGAQNFSFSWLDHHGLRSSNDTSEIFIPFLSDPAVPYNPKFDGDNDGFTGEKFGGPDCDDNNPEVFPGAREVPGDNRDQDCNYLDRAPWGGRDVEVPIKNSLSHHMKKGGDR